MQNKKPAMEINFDGIEINGVKYKDWDEQTKKDFWEGFESNTLGNPNKYPYHSSSSSSHSSTNSHWTDKFNMGDPNKDEGHWVTLKNHKHIFIKDNNGQSRTNSSSSSSKNNSTLSNSDNKSDKVSMKTNGKPIGGAANIINKKDIKEDKRKKETLVDKRPYSESYRKEKELINNYKDPNDEMFKEISSANYLINKEIEKEPDGFEERMKKEEAIKNTQKKIGFCLFQKGIASTVITELEFILFIILKIA